MNVYSSKANLLNNYLLLSSGINNGINNYISG